MKAIHHVCKKCGRTFTGKRTRVYCSKECAKDRFAVGPWNKGKTGIAANRPKTGETRKCLHCNGDFYVQPSRPGKAVYCSLKCYHLSRWSGTRRIEVPCVICGKVFSKFVAEQRTCCGKKCRRKRKSEVFRGQNCHFWRGGATLPYCDGWKQIQREVVERDGGKCVLCGSTNRLSVHHKIPHRYCGHHKKSNLITLCRKCHSIEELKVNEAMRDGLKYRWRHRSSSASKPN